MKLGFIFFLLINFSGLFAQTADWSGLYADKFGTEVKISGPDKNGTVIFKLSEISASCTDEEEGKAYLTNSNIANTNDLTLNDCHYTFTFNEGEIQIETTNCTFGASCSGFDGVYYLAKDTLH